MHRWFARDTLVHDALAALIVTVMLIPQSLAYAMLAGLPAEVGLYASMVPLVVYGLIGTSSTLAVGPVAVLSMMTAAAIARTAEATGLPATEIAVILAGLSGLWLGLLGTLKLGFIANFLSHSVIKGFIVASGILIAVSQLRHLLGVEAHGHSLTELVPELARAAPEIQPLTAALGAAVLAFFIAVKRWGQRVLTGIGCPVFTAELLVKAAPAIAVAVTLALSAGIGLAGRGVGVVGPVPAGLPTPALPSLSFDTLALLAVPALMIALVGYVESISVAQTFAARRRESISANRELLALGAANLGAAATGGMPVTGGFSRSAVSFEAGARTQFAGMLTAVGMAGMTLALAPALAPLPKATLAATIVVAVLSLVDLKSVLKTWRYSRQDGVATLFTIAVTLLVGVEAGIVTGVVISLGLHLYRTSVPHVAVVGLVPGTEHFRNVLRHEVTTDPRVLSVRVDESLYFANAEYLTQKVMALVAASPATEHVILQCSAVNEIDASALHSLDLINHRLKALGICFHLSEVKGPVMDRLKRTNFLDELTGQVFLSHYQAFEWTSAALAAESQAAGGTAAAVDASAGPNPGR